MSKDFTVVIPFYNGNRHQAEELLRTLKSLSIQTILVDDLSGIKLHNYYGAIVLNLNSKGFFSGAVNAGLEALDPEEDVLVLNQDVRLTGTDWIDTIRKYRDEYAMIGEGIKGDHPAWESSYIRGTFMYLRNDAIQKVGLLDQKHYPHWGSTADWQCRAARKGFKIKVLDDIPGWQHLKPANEAFGDSTRQLFMDKGTKKLFHKMIKTPPTISVIIPCFNHGQYLQAAVNSLIGGETDLGYMEGQTFQGFDIIIVDDASTDKESREIGEKLADPWKGIKFVQRRLNGGTSAANNSGIEISTSKYITVMCADDMMESNRLETMLAAIRKDETKVVYDDLMMFTRGERTKPMKMVEYDFNLLIHKNQMHCGIMFKRSAWEKVGGYPEAMKFGREDWAMNVAHGVNGHCGKHIKEPMYLYRRESQNRTLENTTPQWRKFFLGQLQKLFPRIYAGERPDMCCGNRAAPKVVIEKNPTTIQGVNGMALVEYVGKSFGTQSWYGPTTGMRYQFGLTKNKIQNVSPDDLRTNSPSKPGFLEIRESGAPIFRVVNRVEKTKPATAEAIAFKDSVDELKADERVMEISHAAKKLMEDSDMTLDDLFEYLTPKGGSGVDGKITITDARQYIASK